jgi:hypothetical protein
MFARWRNLSRGLPETDWHGGPPSHFGSRLNPMGTAIYPGPRCLS